MDDVSRVVAEVWREACRHIELESAATAIARTIAAHGPFRAVAVLCADATARTVETRVIGWVGRRGAVAPATPPLGVSAWQKLAKWLRDGDLVHATPADAAEWRAALPPGLDGDILLAPLKAERPVLGAMALVADPGQSFAPAHLALAMQVDRHLSRWAAGEAGAAFSGTRSVAPGTAALPLEWHFSAVGAEALRVRPPGALVLPRVRHRSEAVNVDNGQLVGRHLNRFAVVMGLHELAPVGGRAPGRRDGWWLQRLAEVCQNLPDGPRLRDERNQPDVAATRWTLKRKLLTHPGHELGPSNP